MRRLPHTPPRRAPRARRPLTWSGYTRRSGLLLTLSAFGLGASDTARAEGSAELGNYQTIQQATDIYVDVLDHTTETFVWTGTGSATLYAPDGSNLGSLARGSTYNPTQNGAYRLDIGSNQTNFNLTVDGATAGRVFSYTWDINASDYTSSMATNASFYALVDGGGAGRDGVVELKADGLAGFVYYIAANSIGVNGADGRSVSGSGTVVPEYRIYLNPPEVALYNPQPPTLSAEDFTAGSLDCDTVAAGEIDGEFSFNSDVSGTYHLVCDLNHDGAFDIVSDGDLHVMGTVGIGLNTVPWDGTDNNAAPVTPGVYECQITVTVGEFHYVASDIETSYEGFRLFSVDGSDGRTPLYMYWNDSAVQSSAVRMPNNAYGLETSGPDGIYSGSYATAAIPNVNARSWGRFQSTSKGNNNLLDTYTWIYEDITDIFSLRVEDPNANSDGDELLDVVETCEVGTDPTNPDTDGDGIWDDDEHLTVGTDPLDPDSDGDGLSDGDELGSVGSPTDTDHDGLIDAMDPDDDGDGVSTATELLEGDSDADGVDDYLD
ncbi:MAG: hypothetical protein JXX28_08255, partial [Deltaproteobacteria bacterium]|nr:hypothetical protein [Deltaproteobacteria bacterium]